MFPQERKKILFTFEIWDKNLSEGGNDLRHLHNSSKHISYGISRASFCLYVKPEKTFNVLRM